MNWEENSLDVLCEEITVGYVSSMSNEYIEEGIPFLRSLNIEPYKLNLKAAQLKFISKEFHNKLSKSKLNAGDLAIVRTGIPGTCCVIPKRFGEVNCSDLVIARPKEIVNPYFLCYYINSPLGRGSIGGNLVGVAQKHFNVGVAKRMVIPTPPLHIQKRIADILSAYDNLIENNQKRIKLLEQAAQNIYKEWFVILRFPGHENTPINAETGLPVGWEKKPFDEVTVNNNRKRVPINSTQRSKRQGSYRYYGATGVMDYIDDYIFDGRYLLIAEDGTVYDKDGNAYTQLVEGKFWVNNHAHIISEGSLPIEFVYLAMKHYPIGHLITGAVQLKLSMKNLKRVEIINPSKEILKSFIHIVNPLINQIFTLNSQNQKLKSGRDILLPRLMNRTIEV